MHSTIEMCLRLFGLSVLCYLLCLAYAAELKLPDEEQVVRCLVYM